MPPPVQSMGPETLCFRVVRPSARAYVRSGGSIHRTACHQLVILGPIYIFIRINCSFKNKKLKKGKRYTQRVKEHNASNAHY